MAVRNKDEHEAKKDEEELTGYEHSSGHDTGTKRAGLSRHLYTAYGRRRGESRLYGRLRTNRPVRRGLNVYHAIDPSDHASQGRSPARSGDFPA